MGDAVSKRPPPAASGTLAKTPFLHLLIYALEKKLTGTVDVASPDHRVASVLFVDGKPAKAHASEPVSYLGQVLVELGYLKIDVLERTLAELEDARGAGGRALYGEFLQQKGVLDAFDIEAAFREQMARRLRHVAAMPPETTYAYYEGFDALQGLGVSSPRGVDPLPMLWSVLRANAPHSHVEAALSRVATSSLRIAQTADLVRLGLGAMERAALEPLRGQPLTVAELSRVSSLGERDARLLAYLLLVTKQVDVIPASNSSMPARESLTPMMPAFRSTSVPPWSRAPPSFGPVASTSLFPRGEVSATPPPPGLAANVSASPPAEVAFTAADAAAAFKKAEVYFSRGDFALAEPLCRKALEGDATRPDHYAMFAWLLALKPENQTPEKMLKSIRMLDKAISMSDHCERGFYWRGMLNKRIGKTDAAYRDFRKAVDINPRNIDALREIRLHHMRGTKSRSSSPPATMSRPSLTPGAVAKPDEKSGLLGRFFKKS